MIVPLGLVMLSLPKGLDGLATKPFLSGFVAVDETPASRAALSHGTTLAVGSYVKANRKDRDNAKVEISIVRFDSKKDALAGAEQWRRNCQAALIAMPMPGLEKYGYKSYYLGNPRVCEFDAFVGNSWVAVLYVKPNLVWQPARDVSWTKRGAELLSGDKTAMRVLHGLLPEILRRAKAG